MHPHRNIQADAVGKSLTFLPKQRRADHSMKRRARRPYGSNSTLPQSKGASTSIELGNHRTISGNSVSKKITTISTITNGMMPR